MSGAVACLQEGDDEGYEEAYDDAYTEVRERCLPVDTTPSQTVWLPLN